VFGWVYFGALLYWIALFGEMAWASLVLLSAASTAVFGALAPAVWRDDRPVLATFGLAALWTVIEWIRGAYPLGGFGWGQLGTTQLDAPALPLASVAGVWGLSFVVLLVAGLLLLAVERWGRGAWRRAMAPLAVAIGVALLPALIPLPAADGDTIDVAAIQVDVSSVEHLVGDAEDVAVARLNIERHLELADDPPDLVVWGEGSLDPGASGDPAIRAEVSAAIAAVGAPTVSGAVIDDPDGSQHTSALAFDGTGAIVDRYDKVRLVPFGEYVPWRDRLSFIDAIDQVPIDRTPGEEVSNLLFPGLPPLGAPICYENSFPSIERAMVGQGAGLLVVTINNASYERTAASEQHLLMSRMRAVENGRWVVHAAVSGISALIDDRGRVVDSRGLFEPATMRGVAVTSDRTTLYVRFGDWVPWGSIVLVIGLVALPRGRRRAERTPEPLGGSRTLVILPTFNERATIETVLDGLAALGRDLDGRRGASPFAGGSPRPPARTPTQGRARRRLCPRLPTGHRRGLRPRRGDGLGPLAPARGTAEPPRRDPRPRPRDRQPVHPGGVGHQLERRTGRPVEGGEPLRALLPGLHHARCYERLPRLPTTRPRAGDRDADLLGRVRLPGGAGLPSLEPRPCDRRGAHHVPGARARPLQDQPAHRRRGPVAHHPVGTSRPLQAATRDLRVERGLPPGRTVEG
jgi:apolipoprotein N-acyltransferase